MKLLNKAEASVYKGKPLTDPYWPCDAILAVLMMYPDMIKVASSHHAAIELHGSLTRGQIVLDHLKEKETNVLIVEEADFEYFKCIVLEAATYK